MVQPVVQVQRNFNGFYHAEYDRALRLAWLLTHDGERSADVVHDAFVAVYPRFDDLSNPGAYLRSAVVNRVREVARSDSRRHRREDLVAVTAPSSAPAPSDPLVDIIARLPLRQRAVIVLRYWMDLPDAEIAEILGARRATVRSLAFRALKTLNKEISN